LSATPSPTRRHAYFIFIYLSPFIDAATPIAISRHDATRRDADAILFAIYFILRLFYADAMTPTRR
jgi:hypothetical protein